MQLESQPMSASTSSAAALQLNSAWHSTEDFLAQCRHLSGTWIDNCSFPAKYEIEVQDDGFSLESVVFKLKIRRASGSVRIVDDEIKLNFGENRDDDDAVGKVRIVWGVKTPKYEAVFQKDSDELFWASLGKWHSYEWRKISQINPTKTDRPPSVSGLKASALPFIPSNPAYVDLGLSTTFIERKDDIFLAWLKHHQQKRDSMLVKYTRLHETLRCRGVPVNHGVYSTLQRMIAQIHEDEAKFVKIISTPYSSENLRLMMESLDDLA